MDLCTEHRLLDHKELTHRHMRVSERSALEPILICFLFQSLSIWMNFIQTKSSEEKKTGDGSFHARPCLSIPLEGGALSSVSVAE